MAATAGSSASRRRTVRSRSSRPRSRRSAGRSPRRAAASWRASSSAAERGRRRPRSSPLPAAASTSRGRRLVTPIGPSSTIAARPLRVARTGDLVLLSASPDGRDIAGALSALTGMGVLVNATAVRWSDGRPGRRAERLRRPAHHRERLHRHRPGRDHHGPAQQRHGRTAGDRRQRSRRGDRRRRTGAAAGPRSSSASRRPPRARPSRTRGSSSRAAAAWAAPRGSSSSRSSPRRWAAPSGRPGRPWTRAGSRTPSRSARPARSSSRSCTSRSGISGAIQHKVGMQTAGIDRGDQPRSRCPHRRVRGRRRDRRPVRGRPGAARRASGSSGLSAPARTAGRVELAVLLPILAFVALAAGLIVVFRRTDRIVARTREVERFRAAVDDLAARVEVSLAGATGRIDAVRHNALPPAALGRHPHGRHRRRRAVRRGGAATLQGRRAGSVDPLGAHRRPRARRPRPGDGRARGEHPDRGPARESRARRPDVDQAGLPEPPPRPRGDRPPRRGGRATCRPPRPIRRTSSTRRLMRRLKRSRPPPDHTM